MKVPSLIVLLSLFLLNPAEAITYRVGPGKTYTKPSQVMGLVSNGDSVLIDAGVYSGDVGTWSADNLFISGVGGLAHMKAAGFNAQGKAIWVITGDNTAVEYVEFSEATVNDHNGAGIRQEGDNLTLRHCYFHDNENGILAGDKPNSTIIIEYCAFHDNGYGLGQTHNMYINKVASFQLRYSYVHHAKVGHNVKSRAQNSTIAYNRIMDESTGNASYQIDLPNGGNAIVFGNLVQQGPNAENSSMIAYGLEGLSNTTNNLHLYNNSMLNQRSNGKYIRIQAGANTVKVFNNIFAGAGELILGTADTTNNKYYEDATDAGFEDLVNLDFDLSISSSAINAGANPTIYGQSLPFYQYKHIAQKDSRSSNGIIDIGAYEYGTVNPFLAVENDAISLYLTPANNIYQLEGTLNTYQIELKNSSGITVENINCNCTSYQLDLSVYNSGKYYLIANHITDADLQVQLELLKS